MRARIDKPRGTDFNEFPLLSGHLSKPGIEGTGTVNNGGSSRTDFFKLNICYAHTGMEHNHNSKHLNRAYNVPSPVGSTVHVLPLSRGACEPC